MFVYFTVGLNLHVYNIGSSSIHISTFKGQMNGSYQDN